jgi:DNA-binding transcriptional ArsR family regulator
MVISDPKVAKLFTDPLKRQILKYLAEKDLSQKILGILLGIPNPSVYHHLKELKIERLVRVVRSESEVHGILQKFYESIALYLLMIMEKSHLNYEGIALKLKLKG